MGIDIRYSLKTGIVGSINTHVNGICSLKPTLNLAQMERIRVSDSLIQ
jgi:hypothetical protein